MKTCPHCGGELSTAKRSAKNTKEQPTIIRDGKTYYGKMVSYTTGKQMSYASFPDDGKPRKRGFKMSRLPKINPKHLKGNLFV